MADLTSRLILTLIDHVTGPARNVHHAITQVQDRIERNSQAIAAARGDLFGAVAGATAFAAALAAPVGAAARLEEAMADVVKVADFSVPGSYDEFRQGLRDLSREVPIAVEGLAEIAASGAQSGIATDKLLTYVEAAAKIGVAFDISAGEAGSALASLKDSLGVPLEEAILLTDAMNALSNSQNSTAAGILDVQLRVGALGQQFGFANQEVAAFASAMISGGYAPERVATAFANMGYALTMGASATGRQQEAFKALGMTAEQVNRDMQDDAVGTTLAVMDALGKLPAELRSQTAVSLFGREADALIPLLVNMDKLHEALGLVEDQATYAGSAFAEFLVRNRTFMSRLQRFRNVMTDLSIVIGQALIPGLTVLMDRLTPIVEAIIEWAEANGQIVATSARVIGTLIGLRVALLALRLLGLTGRGGYLWLLSQGLLSIGRTAATVQMAVSQSLALQRALAALSGVPMGRLDTLRTSLLALARLTGLSAVASAIGAVVGAIGAISLPVWGGVALVVGLLAMAGAAVYRYWSRLTAIFEGVALAIRDQLGPALDWLASIDLPEPLVGFFTRFGQAAAQSGRDAQAAWNGLRAWMGGLDFSREILTEDDRARIVANTRDLVNRIVAAITALGDRLNDAGVAAMTRFLGGLQSVGETILAWAQGWAQGVADAIVQPIADAMENAYGGGGMAPEGNAGIVPGMGDVSGYASGGVLQPWRPAMVGERGRELIFPSQAAFVATAEQTRRLLDMTRRAAPRPASLAASSASVPAPGPGRAAAPTSIRFGDIIIQGGAAASADELAREFGRQVDTQLRSHYSDAF